LPVRPDARYVGNVDIPSLREVKGNDKRPFGVSNDRCALPTGFNLELTGCARNVVYGITFRYVILGTNKPVYEQTFYGPEMWTRAIDATFVTTLYGAKSTHRFPGFTGPVTGCGDGTQPYGLIDHEVAELLVQAVNERRRGADTSFAVATEQVARSAGTTVEKVVRACDQASAQRYRSRCGPRTG
jgi:hypothetical protein